MTDRAIAALQDAVDDRTPAALRSARTLAALDYLELALAGHWSVDQFRRSTELANDTARGQNVSASLNAIMLARTPPADE